MKPARRQDNRAFGPLIKGGCSDYRQALTEPSWLQRNKNVVYNCYALKRKPPRLRPTTLMVALLAVTWEVNCIHTLRKLQVKQLRASSAVIETAESISKFGGLHSSGLGSMY